MLTVSQVCSPIEFAISRLLAGVAGSIAKCNRWGLRKPYAQTSFRAPCVETNGLSSGMLPSSLSRTVLPAVVISVKGGAGRPTTGPVTCACVTNGQVFVGLSASLAIFGVLGPPSPPPPPTSLPLQINSGGPAVAPFVADELFSGGTTVSTTNTVDLSGVTSPAPEAVYQSNRFGSFSYATPGLTAGKSYTVRLHFAETFWTAKGSRIFNVTINGQQVLTNFDIIGAAGTASRAVVEQLTAAADSAGRITIQFVTVKDNAQVNGIEILS